MKTSRHTLSLSALLTLFCTVTWVALGQTSAPPAAPETPPAAPTAPAPKQDAAADAAASERAAPAASRETEPPLRRIDEPNAADATKDASRSVSVSAGVESDEAGRKGVVTVEEKAPDGSVRRKRSYETRGRSASSEFPFGDHRVGADSKVREVVSIAGSSTVEGEVSSDAVSVLGNTTVGPNAKVGGAAVAVLGRLDVQGEVKDEAVSVLGGTNIDGTVHGEAVAVMGNMRLGPNAVVKGDIVVVGGKLTREPGAVVEGDEVNVPILGGFGDMDWLTTWFKRCALLGRPLAFGQNLGWAWVLALSFLALYVLIGLLFPRAVDRCVETLNTRPGPSIIASILTVLLTPVVLVLLVFTVIGALLVPFVVVGLAFAALFGKAVMLAWLGGRVGRLFTGGPALPAALAVLIGGVIVLGLYVVPVLGFLVFKVLGWLGLGIVVYTVALRMKREKPAPPRAPVVPPVSAPSAPPAGGAVAAMSAAEPTSMSTSGMATGAEPGPGSIGAPGGTAAPDFPPPLTSPGFVGSGATAGAAAAAMPAMPPPSTPLPAAAAVTLPRASLMIRLGALFLDVVLVGLIIGFMSELLPRGVHFRGGPPGVLLGLAIYGAIMWKMRGSTIGGIICGLKVVRLDARELDWPTAIVRALGCFLSLVVAGLGFIWIAIDDERQSWHDKIAGTVVVRVPKGVSLL